ncbi:hypothetical protein WJX81_001120 [Elliptochloris bilobata]|uniref:Uncharacterized protein n=1 Tax=Elliptochloris bilobata TaxID=381761 RepID=A0AAW1RNM5_9CHLO
MPRCASGMDTVAPDVWPLVIGQLDSRSMCSLSASSKLGWLSSCQVGSLKVRLVANEQLYTRLASLVCFVSSRRKHWKVACLKLSIVEAEGYKMTLRDYREREGAILLVACVISACSTSLEALGLDIRFPASQRAAEGLLSSAASCQQLRHLSVKVKGAGFQSALPPGGYYVDWREPWPNLQSLRCTSRGEPDWRLARFHGERNLGAWMQSGDFPELRELYLDCNGLKYPYGNSLPRSVVRASLQGAVDVCAPLLASCTRLEVLHLQSRIKGHMQGWRGLGYSEWINISSTLIACLPANAHLRVLSLTRKMQGPVSTVVNQRVLQPALERLLGLTHLALLSDPVTGDDEMDHGAAAGLLEQVGGKLDLISLEVLVMTRRWARTGGFQLRCSSLRTLVLVMEEMEDRSAASVLSTADLVASVAALADGAPALRALQVVMHLIADWEEDIVGSHPLWRALEPLRSLASLTLGWITHGEPAPHVGERIAAVLDAAIAHLPSVTHLCVHTADEPLELQGLWQHQAGLRGVINAAGRLVKRGVLPSLRRLSVSDAMNYADAPLPRPDAAPRLLYGRRPVQRSSPTEQDGLSVFT